MAETLDTIMEAGLRLFAGFYQGSDEAKREMLDREAYRFINHVRQMSEKHFGWDKAWIDFYDRRKIQ